MELTKKQEEGLKIVIERFLNHDKYTVISGYAGSGKSTLVRFMIDALSAHGVREETDVCFCAYTGKAAQVLIDKGNKNAMTAHRLMYKAIPKPDGSFIFTPKTELEYRVIIVDECSMLPRKMMERLLAYPNIYVVFCGDPGQLPPINKDDDNHLLDHPHIFLDEIMRQAADSGIIQLSMKVRHGENIDNFKSNDAIVLPKTELNTGMLKWADIILCATNATRININNEMRRLLGHEGEICDGDKVINLNNSWETFSENGNALTNGAIGYFYNPFESYVRTPSFAKIPFNEIKTYIGHFVTETNDDFGTLAIDKKMIDKGEFSLTSKQKFLLGRNQRYASLIPYQFTFAYAITTHKAQGSSWKNVLVIEEKFPYQPEEHKRWLYTACTRGEEKVVVVR